MTGDTWRDVEVSFWRDTIGTQSDVLFADNMDAAILNVTSETGFLPCDEDMPIPSGCCRIPILRNGTPLIRKMYAFWPENIDSSLQWEFSESVRQALK